MLKIFLLFCFLFSFSSWAQEKLTLEQCYQLTLKRNENIPISDQDIQQAKARYIQALGTVIPQLAMVASEFLQDDHAQGSTQTAAGNVANTLTRFSRPQVGFTVTQSFFKGLREYQAIRISKTTQSMNRYKKEDVERLLYRDVAMAFYTIAKIELDIHTTKKMISTLKSQLVDLKKRVDLGKSRESEWLAQEASLSLLEADLLKKEGDVKIAYEMLSFLTGLDPQPSIRVEDPLTEKLNPLENYASKIQERPDIQASKKSLEVAERNVNVSRGGLLPNLGVVMGLYPYRVGYLSEVYWDANFVLTVPIFNLTTWGEIKEAKSKALQEALRLQYNYRFANTEVKKAYVAYQASLGQYKKYEVASRKSEASYQSQQEDFRLNLIDHFQVLQVERTWLEALRSRDAAKAQAWADHANLKITSGMVP